MVEFFLGMEKAIVDCFQMQKGIVDCFLAMEKKIVDYFWEWRK